MRASEAEREATVEELRRHAAVGRLWPFMGWGFGVMVHGTCEAGKKRAWASESRRAPRRRAIAS